VTLVLLSTVNTTVATVMLSTAPLGLFDSFQATMYGKNTISHAPQLDVAFSATVETFPDVSGDAYVGCNRFEIT